MSLHCGVLAICSLLPHLLMQQDQHWMLDCSGVLMQAAEEQAAAAEIKQDERIDTVLGYKQSVQPDIDSEHATAMSRQVKVWLPQPFACLQAPTAIILRRCTMMCAHEASRAHRCDYAALPLTLGAPVGNRSTVPLGSQCSTLTLTRGCSC